MLDFTQLKSDLTPTNLAAYYRDKADVGIDLGPSFRTLKALWARPGEALGEICLPNSADRSELAYHPLVLDGCFQVMGAARGTVEFGQGGTYLPFSWERLELPKRLPNQLLCHVCMRGEPYGVDDELPEVMTRDINLYDLGGSHIGMLNGYAVKKSNQSALLAAVEDIEDLLYEVEWRDHALPPGMLAADFLPSPSTAASRSLPFSSYLADEGVKVKTKPGCKTRWRLCPGVLPLSAMEALGWERKADAVVDPEELCKHLEILPEHEQLLRRMLEIVARSGVLRSENEYYVVTVGVGDPLPRWHAPRCRGVSERDGGTFPARHQ